MKKVRRKIIGEKDIQTKNTICRTIKKAIQIKFAKKWITIHKYEIELWIEKN